MLSKKQEKTGITDEKDDDDDDDVMTMITARTVGYTHVYLYVHIYACMYVYINVYILLCTCLLLRGGLFVLFKRCCCPLLIVYTHTHTRSHVRISVIVLSVCMSDPTCYFGCRKQHMV